jgi:cytidylate kinase
MSTPALQIAIDGPAASGKSTVAKRLATVLNAAYVDTGQMYRALTWLALREGVDPKEDADAVLALLDRFDLQLARGADGRIELQLDAGPVPAAEVRGPEVAACVSYVARIPKVREWMVTRQRASAEFGLIVMEGRDIGTVVFPRARLKFFVTASPEARATRRLAQEDETVCGATLASVAAEIAARDRLDSTRAVAPLRPADDAEIVDTTELSIDDVVDALQQRVTGELAELQ